MWKVEGESIEWFIEDHAFPRLYDLEAPRRWISNTQDDWERESKGGEGVG